MTLDITNNNNLIETLQQVYPITANVGYGDLGSFQAASDAAAASAISAANSSSAAGAASGRLEVATFAELASVFGYSATGGRRIVAAGDLIRVINIDCTYQVLASGASGAHLNYESGGGVKLILLPGAQGLNVLGLGVTGDNVTDDGPAFSNAAAIGPDIAFVVPEGFYLCNSTIDILSGQTWTFCGAQIRTTVEDRPIIRANGRRDFSLLGRLRLKGTLVTAESVTTADGFQVTNGKRYVVQGVEASLFKGHGFLVDGTTTGGTASRGDRGQWSDCSAHQNTTGIEFAPGAGAEYVTVSNFTASGNTLGVAMDAGNVTFLGGNVVDNTNGIFLTGVGSNNCHGIFDGVNINHNTQSNIKADGVTRGHTFTGCHIYGNAAGSQGNIWFLNSRGILIQGGIIDAWIYNDLGSGSVAGINRVQGAYLPTNHTGGTGNTALQSNDGGLVNLEVLDCWTYTGPASLNDPSPVFVRATRGASTQSLTSGVQNVLIFNSVTGDKKGCYDPATGVFTCKVAGTYEFSYSARITGTGLSAPFGSFRVNGSATVDAKGSAPSSTLALVGDTVVLTLTVGQTVDVTAQITGTSPVMALNVSRLAIRLLR